MKDMKTIYVTVAEYLENGGELKFGRMVYTLLYHSDTEMRERGAYEYFDSKYVYYNTGDNHVNEKMPKGNIYVKVEVKPIYK